MCCVLFGVPQLYGNLHITTCLHIPGPLPSLQGSVVWARVLQVVYHRVIVGVI